VPIDTRDWYKEKRHDYKPPHNRWKPPRRKLPAGKIFLIFLIVACVVATIYTSYLLFTHRTNWGVGAIVLAADIGVLIWNIAVLRKYRVGAGTVISILVAITLLGAIVSAFAGVEPLAGYKDRIINNFTGLISGYDIKILPGQLADVDDWAISLDGGGWKDSTLIVELTITNLGPRRNFGYAGLDVGPELVVIDSTGKLIEPWVPEPDIEKGELLVFPPYTREFYPNESWTGSLKFEMSPYSGETKLYMTRYYHMSQYFLFDLGCPPKVG